MVRRILFLLFLPGLLCSCAGHQTNARTVPTPLTAARPPAAPRAGGKHLSSTNHPQHRLRFLVTDFESIPGFRDVGISAINNSGQVAGMATKIGAGMPHAFLFSHGTGQDLGSFGGSGSASAMNDRGDVAGEAQGLDGLTHAVLWRKGHMKDLGVIGERWNHVIGLNDSDQVIGLFEGGHSHDYFLYSGGRMHDLGTSFSALAINRAGQILGLSHGRLCLRSGRRVDTLPIKAHEFPIVDAADMNNEGQIAYTAGNGIEDGHAWIYSRTKRIDLGRLVPGAETRTYSINNRGQVVGAVPGSGGDWGALLWQNGKAYSLDDPDEVELSPHLPSGTTLTSAYYINDRGQIIVVGKSSAAGSYHGYLLTPVR